ncbi:hypothetical protein [Streptomyces olivaceiscleroticus]|uniref:Uncharacterized protein n=1 Tax=Streptomyces olivaceiscleroticus TaxID=68245 RepID=A0ABP3LIG0_9ACTN
MSSQSPITISQSPAPWGPYAAITVLLAALPADQLEHLVNVLNAAGLIGNLIRLHLGELDSR